MQLEKRQRETISLLAPLVGPIVKQLHDFTHSGYIAVKPCSFELQHSLQIEKLAQRWSKEAQEARVVREQKQSHISEKIEILKILEVQKPLLLKEIELLRWTRTSQTVKWRSGVYVAACRLNRGLQGCKFSKVVTHTVLGFLVMQPLLSLFCFI